jgi:hypothetical protein
LTTKKRRVYSTTGASSMGMMDTLDIDAEAAQPVPKHQKTTSTSSSHVWFNGVELHKKSNPTLKTTSDPRGPPRPTPRRTLGNCLGSLPRSIRWSQRFAKKFRRSWTNTDTSSQYPWAVWITRTPTYLRCCLV